MTPTPPYEVPASDSVLLSSDGRVLQVFGRFAAARYDIREERSLESRSGRSRRPTVALRNGRQHNMAYDEQRLPGLRALVDLPAGSVSERQQS
ncbi:hypothetical protein [Streptomyces fulvoviolaceus]|uniref:hypothetical protein n=1 Tax=Streptomyces fulvoviolaceus TaxID=285535 RepID=UPI0004C81310|nr:hypothetical protein [Streptomyces fulvoviolaceus]